MVGVVVGGVGDGVGVERIGVGEGVGVGGVGVGEGSRSRCRGRSRRRRSSLRSEASTITRLDYINGQAFDKSTGKGLMDVWGEEFDAMYTRLEKEGKGRKTIKAGGGHFETVTTIIVTTMIAFIIATIIITICISVL